MCVKVFSRQRTFHVGEFLVRRQCRAISFALWHYGATQRFRMTAGMLASPQAEREAEVLYSAAVNFVQHPHRTTVFNEDLIAPFASGASYSRHYFIASGKVCFPRFPVFRLKDCRCKTIVAATQELRVGKKFGDISWLVLDEVMELSSQLYREVSDQRKQPVPVYGKKKRTSVLHRLKWADPW